MVVRVNEGGVEVSCWCFGDGEDKFLKPTCGYILLFLIHRYQIIINKLYWHDNQGKK